MHCQTVYLINGTRVVLGQRQEKFKESYSQTFGMSATQKYLKQLIEWSVTQSIIHLREIYIYVIYDTYINKAYRKATSHNKTW